MCTMCTGSYIPTMKSVTIFCDPILDIKLLVHPLLNSVPMNIHKPKVSNESQISEQLSENEFLFFSQAEKNSRFGKLVSDSSVAQYRSSKANSEEAGITRGWYHQSQLIINT